MIAKNFSVKAKLVVVFVAGLIFINGLGLYGLYSMSQTIVNVKNIVVDCMGGILSAKNMRDLVISTKDYELNIVLKTNKNLIV